MLLASIPLFAQAAGNSSVVDNSIQVACAIVSVLVAIVAVAISARRNPPLGEDVHRIFIPRSEHVEAMQRIDRRVDDAFEEISTIRGMHTQAFGDLERAIGRLEGKSS